MGEIVVLLGGPGSGKSTVAAELARLGFRWRDWEAWLLEKWGGREAFLERKAEALAELHASILEFADEDDAPPLVIESTGLSDGPFLDRLRAERLGTLIVRLDVAEDDALGRIATRAAGMHLSDDESPNRQTWRAYEALVLTRRVVDFVIDSAVAPADAAKRIRDFVGKSR